MLRKMGISLLILGICLSLQFSVCAFEATGKVSRELGGIGGTVKAELTETAARDGGTLAMPVLKKIISTGSGVKLTWRKVKEADGYLVCRCELGEENYSVIGEMDSAKSLSFTDKKVVSGGVYKYAVRAFKAVGEDVILSPYEGYVHVFLPKVKKPAVKNTGKGIEISWKKVKGADIYELLRWENNSDTPLFLGYVDRGRTSCTDRGAQEGKTYSYALRAVKIFNDVYYCGPEKTRRSEFLTCRHSLESKMDHDIVVYRALLIGESDYSHAEPPLKDLHGPVFDVQSMSVALSEMNYSQVVAKQNVSKADVLKSIKSTFQNADSNDVSLFFFSGHGETGKNDTYSGSLVTVDGKLIAPYELASALKAVPGRIVVVMDCCGSGATITDPQDLDAGERGLDELKAFNQKICSCFASQDEWITAKYGELMDENKFHVMTAAKPWESSMDYATNVGTYFGSLTYGILMGAGYIHWHPLSYTGQLLADQNHDHCINLEESFVYAIKAMDDLNLSQTFMRYPEKDSLVLFMH